MIISYVEDDMVCFAISKKGLFTTDATENKNHKPASSTTQTSFHGTSISSFLITRSVMFTMILPAHFTEKNPTSERPSAGVHIPSILPCKKGTKKIDDYLLTLHDSDSSPVVMHWSPDLLELMGDEYLLLPTI